MLKCCSKCKEYKDISLFSTNKEAKDGKHYWCRECTNSSRRGKKYTISEEAKLYRKEYKRKFLETEQGRLQKSKWDKKYRDTNKEKISAQKKEFKRKNPAIVREWKKTEYEKHRDAYILRAYNRLGRIKAQTPDGVDYSIISIIYQQARRLSEDTGLKHEVDHIIPLSKGGKHHQDNLQVLPWYENRWKGDKYEAA